MELKYRVINVTVKPITRDAKGNDTRKAMDKVGYPVKFKEKDRDVIIHPNQARLVSELNSGLIELQKGGYVKVEKVEDMNEALKDHVFQPEEVKPAKEELKVKAVEMGLDDYKQESGKEVEGAVNPDGDPNFLVKVKRNKKNATTTPSVQKNGEGVEVPSSVSQGHSSTK